MDEQQHATLLDDYAKTQAFIDKIDRFMFWIRNWAIVATSAVIAFSVVNHCQLLILVNIPILLGFLFIELIQKSFHEDAIGHTYTIEAILQDSVFSGKPVPSTYAFGLGHTVQTIESRKLLAILCKHSRWHNLAFYVLLATISLGAVLVSPLLPRDQTSKGTIQKFEN